MAVDPVCKMTINLILSTPPRVEFQGSQVYFCSQLYCPAIQRAIAGQSCFSVRAPMNSPM